MWVEIACPNCQGKVEVDTTQPVHMVRCPECQKSFRPKEQVEQYEYTLSGVASVVYDYADVEHDSSFWLG